jgi:queuine tRNA-ribosyltransferase
MVLISLLVENSLVFMYMKFKLESTDGAARAGSLSTPHGHVPTPVFMPLATQGSVKTLTPQELKDLGATILLGNTYHLHLRPGTDLVQKMGGVGAFMGWDGATLTDSGGFQAYSLGKRVHISNNGLKFHSHIDGTSHMFTPEHAIRYQEALGADIIMALDQCIDYTTNKSIAEEAMERTHMWAKRCNRAHSQHKQLLFGIVQGGMFSDLRQRSAAFLTGLDFPGYAIGGLGVGEPKEMMYSLVNHTASLLPHDRPRYLMGIGSPEDLVECVARGVDMFDCALPTRVARHGAVFTQHGRVNITVARFRGANLPIDEKCDCYTCNHFTAGYLHHLFRAEELLGLRLATIHNLRFMIRLMDDMREAILNGEFETFAREFIKTYEPANKNARMSQRKQWVTSTPNKD